MKGKTRVLVIDDSALVRQILDRGLSLDPEIEVVGTAADAYMARDKIVKLKPSVLTLDVEMPKMDGIEFLRRLMPQYPLPVVMVSSLTQRGRQITLDALEAGAVDFVTKPTSNLAQSLEYMIKDLREKVKIASRANVSHWKKDRTTALKAARAQKSKVLVGSTDKVIAIGASTGGTEAIKSIITQFPPTMPGVVIVQHMPAGFTKMFAERLNQLSAMDVKEAQTGDRIRPGCVLVAPGGKHLKVIRSGGNYQVNCQEGEKVSGHCPSVDVLMDSVAKEVGSNAIGIILTGMGADGANGILNMRRAGAINIAQDEATCVVFGMPKVAFERGGVQKLVPLSRIASETINLLSEI